MLDNLKLEAVREVDPSYATNVIRINAMIHPPKYFYMIIDPLDPLPLGERHDKDFSTPASVQNKVHSSYYQLYIYCESARIPVQSLALLDKTLDSEDISRCFSKKAIT